MHQYSTSYTHEMLSYTHIASEIITNTYLGTFANHGKIVIALLPNVYIVGAHALGTVNANSTVRNLPKPPQGDKTA